MYASELEKELDGGIKVVAGRGALIKFPDGSECSLGAVKSGLLNVDVHNGGLQSQAAAFADHVMNDICGVKGACSTMEAEIYKTACGMIYDELERPEDENAEIWHEETEARGNASE